MISNILEKLFNVWRQLSKREQMLALATASVVLLVILFAGYQRSQTHLDELDREILRLEDELVSSTRLLEHRDATEAEYAIIAAQHSSEWTEAEIHDRLRQEIYRLAQNTPAPLDANGIPIPNAANIGNLVEIPSLGKGQMTEGGTGYREYRINLRIPATRLRNIIQFLERLHNSPQSLRIDSLDLNRHPESEGMAASIDISRIVAEGSPITDSVQHDPGSIGRINLNAAAWQTHNASVKNIESQSIHGAVSVHMMAGSSEIYMTQSLPGGKTYEMTVNLSSSSPDITLGIDAVGNKMIASPMQPLTSDGAVHRYQSRITLPDNGTPVSIRCPLLHSSSKTGALVKITGLLLQEASEIYQ